MGTRADFYVGRGEQAEWIGSVAWDGYPEGIDAQILGCASPEAFRHAVTDFLRREDATLPERGWPWPWDDSQTTDYAYAFDGERVWCSIFGCEWFPVADHDRITASDEEYERLQKKQAVFPNMKDRKNVRWDKGSGVIVVTG